MYNEKLVLRMYEYMKCDNKNSNNPVKNMKDLDSYLPRIHVEHK